MWQSRIDYMLENISSTKKSKAPKSSRSSTSSLSGQTPLAPLNKSTVADANVARGVTAVGSSGYRAMLKSFSEVHHQNHSSLEVDSQEMSLNTPPGFVHPSISNPSEDSPLQDSTGTTVEETPAFSVPNTVTTVPGTQQLHRDNEENSTPHEWEDIQPSAVIRCLKAIPANILSSLGMREFYKAIPCLA
jgi:hypothetical protein